VNRRLALLKAVCKHAWKQGLHPENLSGRISLLREDNKREVYLTITQVRRLAKNATNSEVSAAIMIAAYTGLRASELLALSTATITSRSLTVSQSKTGKPRVVPLPLAAQQYVRALPLGISYWQLHSEFCKAREAAGLPHVQFHDLRHTCASWLINAGVDLYTVGKILGHTTPATTARYAHLSTQTLAKAMARLK
jgi:integrase